MSSRPFMPRFAGALLLAATLAPQTASQFVYSLATDGRVNVNAVEIANLKGGASVFGDGYLAYSAVSQSWVAQAIDGPDWWALRADGNVNKNAEPVYSLATDDSGFDFWASLLILDGAVWTLRTDGRVDINGEFAVSQPQGGDEFPFTRLITNGTNVWELRGDGHVFQDLLSGAVFAFNGPDSVGGHNDGEGTESTWARMAVDPVDGTLWGVRRDGRLQSYDLGAPADGELPEATEVTSMPFPSSEDDVDISDYYVDLEFLTDGTWVALRGNGKVYVESSVSPFFTEAVQLPGGSEDNPYTDVLAADDDWLALRQDGRVYLGTGTDPVAELSKKNQIVLSLGAETPCLTNAKTQPPTVANTSIAAVTGEPVVLCVIVTDPDTPDDELVLTIDPDTVPPGAVWDDEARTLTWDDPGPKGSYKFKLEASDGVNKPAKRTFKIKVKDPDTNPGKNIKPVAAKIKAAKPLDGTPFSMRIQASDRDGDELAITAQDLGAYPYTAGASFDEKTATFNWTASLADVGKTKLTFLVGDGTVTVKRKITIQVQATLLTFP